MINVLICDDDKNIRDKVRSLIENIQSRYMVNFNIEVKESGEFINTETTAYDIAVVDIEMPKISGLEVAEKLKEVNSDAIVIILTSYSAYLDNAMKISVFRYLSKPIDEGRFERNFLEALQYHREICKHIVIEKGKDVFAVKTKDILYIENTKHGSIIVTKTDSFKTNVKPEEWLKKIAQYNCFVYSHKSYIVNLQNVVNFDKQSVVFSTGTEKITLACISQRKYNEFKKAFYDFMGGIK